MQDKTNQTTTVFETDTRPDLGQRGASAEVNNLLDMAAGLAKAALRIEKEAAKKADFPDFSHRISPFFDGKLTPDDMAETVGMSARKAAAVVTMLGEYFTDDEGCRQPLNADSIYYALKSVQDELTDIREIVDFFASQQK